MWGGEEPWWGGAGRKGHCFRRSCTPSPGSHGPSASPVGHFSCPCPPHWILTPPSPHGPSHLRLFPMHSIPSAPNAVPSCPPRLLSQLDALVPASLDFHGPTRTGPESLPMALGLPSHWCCCQIVPGSCHPHRGQAPCWEDHLLCSRLQLQCSALHRRSHHPH